MKILSIKKSADFGRIKKSNQKFFSPSLILLSSTSPKSNLYDPKKSQNAANFCRIGYTVAKTISKSAVVRNRIKRQLRQAFKGLVKFAKENHDYVIIAKKEICDHDYQKICLDLQFCLKRIHNVSSFKKQTNDQNKNVRPKN